MGKKPFIVGMATVASAIAFSILSYVSASLQFTGEHLILYLSLKPVQ